MLAVQDPSIQAGKVDDVPIDDWLADKITEVSQFVSFSTDHQAFFYACHWGLSEPIGTRLDAEFKDEKKKKRKRTITYSKNSTTPWGPAVFPEGLESTKDLNYGVLESGHGYVHVPA